MDRKKQNDFIETILNECLNEDIFKVDNSIKKYEKLIINAIILFLKEEWNFEADITVKKKRSNKFIGDIALNDNSIKKNKFNLTFDPNQTYLGIIKSLIHELTHVKQVSNGELKPREDYKAILWKDNYEISAKDYNKLTNDYAKYNNLPWEKEAYKNMEDISLRNKLFNSPYWLDLKGKDANVDFIIDNL